MRASVFFAAPLVAMAAAQSSTANETSVLSTIPVSSSSVPYTNGFTSFLTQTNSLGVVTGQPLPATSVGVAATNSAPAAISSVAVQLVPAGLAPGTVTTLIYGNVTAGNATSIVVTVGASTTQILSAAVIAATGSGSSASGSSAAAAASSSGSSASQSGSSSRGASSASSRASSASGSASSATGSAAASSTGAASNVKVGAGALIGAGVFFAAFM
ncbi:hypothetical protein E4T52_03907 [Aureobasidium sp. EXF-3400]|nr:hypothetical protein E4T51_06134 [Aureobasidium sp. EXF-12344]KAI4781201.1 hypothetical protein E4T52_03907 [Aureobasidium sp. EXF-3400]